MSIALQLAIRGGLRIPVFVFLRICVDELVSKRRKKNVKIAGVSQSNGVVGKTSRPCLAKGTGTYDSLGSLAGIDCGVAKAKTSFLWKVLGSLVTQI